MDSDIWREISEYFPKEQSHFIDLGFINSNNVANIPNDDSNIFITHSLGTLWALKHHAPNMAGLIAINGFTNFTNFTPKRILQAMQKQLQRSPSQQMSDFWNSCGLDEPLNKNLNIDKLHEGLKWLIDWDMNAELNNLSVPALSLIGSKDPFLPLEKVEKQWAGADVKIAANGGHILPLSHPKWCAQAIREFIIEYKLEK